MRVPQLSDDGASGALVKATKRQLKDISDTETTIVQSVKPYLLKNGGTLGKNGPLIVNGRPQIAEPRKMDKRSKGTKAIVPADPDIPVPRPNDHERRQKILSDDDGGGLQEEDDEGMNIRQLLQGSQQSYAELTRGAAELASDSEADERPTTSRRESKASKMPTRSPVKGVRKSTAQKEEIVCSSKSGPSGPTHQNKRTRSSNSPKRPRQQLADTLVDDSSEDDSDGVVVANSSTVIMSRKAKPSEASSKRRREEAEVSSTARREEEKSSKRRRREEREQTPRKSSSDSKKRKDKGKERQRQPDPVSGDEAEGIISIALTEDEKAEGFAELLPPRLSGKARRHFETGGPKKLKHGETAKAQETVQQKNNVRHSPVRLVAVSDEAPTPPREAREESYDSYSRPFSRDRGGGPTFEEMDWDRPEMGAVLNVRDEQDPEPSAEERRGVLESGISEAERQETMREQDQLHLSVSHEQAKEATSSKVVDRSSERDSASPAARHGADLEDDTDEEAPAQSQQASRARQQTAATQPGMRARKGQSSARVQESVSPPPTEIDALQPALTVGATVGQAAAPISSSDSDITDVKPTMKAKRSAATLSANLVKPSRMRPKTSLSAQQTQASQANLGSRNRSRKSRSASARTASPPKPSSVTTDIKTQSKKSRASHGAPTKPGRAQIYTDTSSDEEVPVQKSSTVAAAPEPEQEALPSAAEEDDMRVDPSVPEAGALPPAVTQRAGQDERDDVRVAEDSTPVSAEPASTSGSHLDRDSPQRRSLREAEPADESSDEDAALAEIAAAIAARASKSTHQIEVSATYTISYDVDVTEMWSDGEEDDFLNGIAQLFEGLVEEPEQRARLPKVKSPAPRPSRKGKERAVDQPAIHESMQVDNEPSRVADSAAGPVPSGSTPASPRRSPRQRARDLTPEAERKLKGVRSSPRAKPLSGTTSAKSPDADNESSAGISDLAGAHSRFANIFKAQQPEMTSDEEVAMQVTSVRKPRTALSDKAAAVDPSPAKDDGKARESHFAVHKRRKSSAHIVVEVPHSPYHNKKLVRHSRADPFTTSSTFSPLASATRHSEQSNDALRTVSDTRQPVSAPPTSKIGAETSRRLSAEAVLAAVEALVNVGIGAADAVEIVEPASELLSHAIELNDDVAALPAETSAAAEARETQGKANICAGSEQAVEQPTPASTHEASGADDHQLLMDVDDAVREEVTRAVQAQETAASSLIPVEVEVSMEEEEDVLTTIATAETEPDTSVVQPGASAEVTAAVAETVAAASTAAGAVEDQPTGEVAELIDEAPAVTVEEVAERMAEDSADIDAAVEDIIDAATQTLELAEADADVEGEEESPEIESSLPGPSRDNAAGGVEDVSGQASTSADAANGLVESSEESSTSEDEEDAIASESGSDNDAEAEPEEEPPFSQNKLVAWADDLKGKIQRACNVTVY